MKEVLIKIAYDENQNIVFADNAIKGRKYYCLDCKEELTYRNSGKTGKGSRRPHFAHRGGGGHNCDPESVLHAAFKNEAAKLLEGFIAENKGFDIKWTCKECGIPYVGNLLFVAKSVKVEYDLKECKPDIALLDETRKVRIAVEIVKTHEPEDNAIKYYKEHGIILVKYNVVEEDLHRIEDKLKNPDYVSLCLRSNCKNLNPLLITTGLFKRNAECPKCHEPITIFFIENRTAVGHIFYLGLNKYVLKDYNLNLNQLNCVTMTDMNSKVTFETYMTKCRCMSGKFIIPAKKDI